MPQSRKRPIHQYTLESMVKALDAVKKGMAVTRASRQYQVPKTSLLDRVHGRIPIAIRKMGPPPILTKHEETELCDWLRELAKRGFAQKKYDLINSASKIIKLNNRKNPFKNNTPGNNWHKSFLSRHPELRPRKYEKLNQYQSGADEKYIRDWFSAIKTYLRDIKQEDILTNPLRILIGDEMTFSICSSTGEIRAPKKWMSVYEINPLGKENVTVLFVFSAAGDSLNPMVVFPVVQPAAKSVSSNCVEEKSQINLLKCDVFHDYILSGVNRWLIENNIPKPVILFIDGHKSHLSHQLMKSCDENGIILYPLPEKTTESMQPANIVVFKPIKAQWDETVFEWKTNAGNINCVVEKSNFCQLLKYCLEMAPLADSVRNGLKSCGLFPFNPDAVDYSKCICKPKNTKKYDLEVSQEEIDTTIRVLEVFRDDLESRGIDVKMVIDNVTHIYKAYQMSVYEANQSEVKAETPEVERNENIVLIQLNNTVKKGSS